MIHGSLLTKVSSFLKKQGSYNSEKNYQVCTDSRRLKKDDVFICLKGDRFDGHQFAQQAAEQGAALVVVDNNFNYKDFAFPLLIVEETTLYLQEIAQVLVQNWRSKKPKRHVIGIAGSNGKTTQKEMLTFLLKQVDADKVLSTEKNFNNHIGVPQTILNLTDQHDVLVLELGTNHPGELARLCEIAQPDYGIITNIGKEHLEFFKDLDGVFQEERALYDSIKKNYPETGCIILNSHDPYLKKLELFGQSRNLSESQVQLTNSHLHGDYQRLNLKSAFLMALQVYPEKEIFLKEQCTHYKPGFNRASWIEKGSKKFFLDAYNANPDSMESSLKSFKDYCLKNEISLNSVLIILGDMKELGKTAQQEHCLLGKLISDLGFSQIVFIGEYSQAFQEKISSSLNVQCFLNVEDYQKTWFQQQKLFHFFFLKASRGISLEKLL